MMVDKVRKYYETGLWSIDRVWNVVGKAITEEDYYDITGYTFPEKGGD